MWRACDLNKFNKCLLKFDFGVIMRKDERLFKNENCG